MILIAFVDDGGGMMFNHRRQSRDRAALARILDISAGSALWMNEYSAPLFTEFAAPRINVDAQFLDTVINLHGNSAGVGNDHCFASQEICAVIIIMVENKKAKSRLDEVEAEIHDKNSRRKSIEHYLSLLEERKNSVTEYDVRLWHGMVEFVTVYSKDDILFAMKDGMEIRV